MLHLVLALASLLVVGVCFSLALAPIEFRGQADKWVHAPPETVWECLQDFRPLPLHVGAAAVAPLPKSDYQPAWREEVGSDVITVETLDQKAPCWTVLRLRARETPLRARWQISLSPERTGTRVRILQTGSLGDDAEASIGEWLSLPGRRLEMALSGARAQPRDFLEALADAVRHAQYSTLAA